MSAASVSNKYTTSSGRIVKNPTNYPVTAANALQSQKRVRIGAVTRSLISSSGSSAHSSVNVVGTQSATPAHSSQSIDNVTTVKVTGPTIMPITTQEPEHFMKVWITKAKYILRQSATTYFVSLNIDIVRILLLQSVTKTITSDILSTRTKIIKDSDESTSDRTIYKIINKPFNRNESSSLSNYPDIEIIRRDDTTVGKSIPHDIPADIELIPMSADHASAFGKRSATRSFSPENIASKLTKLNDCSVLVTSSNETPKMSNAITMSAINLKMLRESQQRTQVKQTKLCPELVENVY